MYISLAEDMDPELIRKYIDGDIKNSFIYLNDDLIDVDEKKFKYLKLERFHNK